jgi:hypothetical protein
MDGGRSSPDLHGGRAGCLSDMAGQGTASKGSAGTGRRTGRRVERTSRRWRRRTARRRPGEGTAAAAERRSGAERLREGEEREETSKGSYVKLKRSRGLTVKQKSPLIQSSKAKVPKNKVVEFFKLYKNALGLKFQNSKFAALQDRFRIEVKFKLPWSLPR